MTGIYQNLGEEIEMMKIQLKDLEVDHKYLMKNMEMNAPKCNGVIDYSQERVKGGPIPLTLDEIAGRYDRIQEKSAFLHQRIEEKKGIMEELQQVLRKKKGLEQQIIYLRDVKGMNLKEVAAYLGYTHQYIRKVSSRMSHRSNIESTQRQQYS
ncbi:hypothetical protein COC69_01275 [Bacillus cereus]|uniref:Uncharacterized protein n=1 Tax=Bacillus cereus TaxID=1396 RepID=A0A9X7CSJ6_BACCE|nr:hypothetical protein [Bacillus cereus]PGS83972.1 hypothetical protein COC69_01275 [Bacillus cereus]